MKEQAITLAKKYATAFLNVFGNEVSLDDYHKIEGLSSYLKNRRDALVLLALSHIKSDEKCRLLADIVKKFNMSACFSRLMCVLVKSNRAYLLPIILKSIAALYRKRMNIEDFMIYSSLPLPKEKQTTINMFLSKKTGAKIISQQSTATTLIAGIRLLSSNYLWEYSVAKKLRSLKMSPVE